MKLLFVLSMFLVGAHAQVQAQGLKPIHDCLVFSCDGSGRLIPNEPVCTRSFRSYERVSCETLVFGKILMYSPASKEVVKRFGYDPEPRKKVAKKTPPSKSPAPSKPKPALPCYTDEHSDFKVEFDEKGKPTLYRKVGGKTPGSYAWIPAPKDLNQTSEETSKTTGQHKVVYDFQGTQYTVVDPIPSSYSRDGVRIQDGSSKEILLVNDSKNNHCVVGREYNTDEKKVKYDQKYCKDVRRLLDQASDCAQIGTHMAGLVNSTNERIEKDHPKAGYTLGIDLSHRSAGKDALWSLMDSGAMCRSRPEYDRSEAAIADPSFDLEPEAEGN